MRIRVDYSTVYDYSMLASDVVQLLRVEPCGHEDQHVVSWRLDTDTDGHLRRGHDAFGNVIHMFYADAPIRRLSLHVSGEVDTNETNGVLRGTAEPLSTEIFLRATPLTTVDASISQFALQCRQGSGLDTCHAILNSLYERMSFDADVTHSHTDAAHAFKLMAGVCQDYSHIFCAAARLLGIPARYVSGHLVRADGLVTQPAGHAWVEAYIADLGWVGFDPTNGMSTTEAYLRVAVGLDYLDAAPVRGARRGGGAETMVVSVTASDAHAPTILAPMSSCPRSGAGAILNSSGQEQFSSRGGESLTMTYCIGILVREGMVMLADTRTNAGVDNISTYRKLRVLETGHDRVSVVTSAGSLSVTQSATSRVALGVVMPDSGEKEFIDTAPTVFRCAQIIGQALSDAKTSIEMVVKGERVSTDASLLFGGSIDGRKPRMFLIYGAGNFIECQTDTPFLQIGEHKYGKPVLDRMMSFETPMAEAIKIALISFSATMRSNLAVGLPIDIVTVRRRRVRARAASTASRPTIVIITK